MYHANEHSGYQTGQTIRTDKPSEGNAAVLNCMASGEPLLQNPHGLKRFAEKVRSTMPLKTIDGEVFACLVSGPPAVPDELLETLGRHAGPLLERIWKKDQMTRATNNVMDFIKTAANSMRKLVYTSFHADQIVESSTKSLVNVLAGQLKASSKDVHEAVWHWQPLKHTSPYDFKKFVLTLQWSLGEPIGSLVVSCGTFTDLNEELLVLLHVTAAVLLEALEEIEELTPGNLPPLATTAQVLVAFEKHRPNASQILVDELTDQIQSFDAAAVFSELRHYDAKSVDPNVQSLVQGVLLLLGYKPRAIATWNQCRNHLKNHRKLKDLMQDLDVESSASAETARFNAMAKCMRGIDRDALRANFPGPVKLMVRWLNAVEMTHNIALAEIAEEQRSAIDESAEQIFKTIDADGDGFIDAKELVGYMVREYPSAMAHRLLRTLDTDNDSRISRDEWHKGWNAGHLLEVLNHQRQAMAKKEDELDPSAISRLTSRRGRTGPMALTVAAAAREFEMSQLEKGSSSSSNTSMFSKKGTKKKK